MGLCVVMNRRAPIEKGTEGDEAGTAKEEGL